MLSLGTQPVISLGWTMHMLLNYPLMRLKALSMSEQIADRCGDAG